MCALLVEYCVMLYGVLLVVCFASVCAIVFKVLGRCLCRLLCGAVRCFIFVCVCVLACYDLVYSS